MIKKIIVIASIIGLIAFGIPMTDNNRVLASETESGSILTDLVDIDTIEEWRTYADQHGIERDTTYDDCEAVDFMIQYIFSVRGLLRHQDRQCMKSTRITGLCFLL